LDRIKKEKEGKGDGDRGEDNGGEENR